MVLRGFGYLELRFIGMPFLLFGIALAILYPFRRRREVFWSSLAALAGFVLGFLLGFLLLAPLECTAVRGN